MCLLLFAYRCHSDYPLLLLANRDEFYARPSAPAALWEGGKLVAGRDLQAGGTWLGIAGGGRVAAVTNMREPGRAASEGALSRGAIPQNFLCGNASPAAFAKTLAAEHYRGFNTLLFHSGAEPELLCAGNRHSPLALPTGIHGISNGAPDAPWPKVVKGRAGLEQLLAGISGPLHQDNFVRPGLALLQDRAPAAEAELPHTGVSPALELALSSIFVQVDRGDFPTAAENPGAYGTRASTLVAVDREGRCQLWEQSYRDGRAVEPLRHFQLS
jgi:uncharacterized protein with NRDE domain